MESFDIKRGGLSSTDTNTRDGYIRLFFFGRKAI